MAEKIEMFAGWDWDGSAIVGRERNFHIDKECTVVVHDGKAERVFTESEVRAIMEHMLDDNWFMHGTAEAREEKIRHMAKTHGIVLDPA